MTQPRRFQWQRLLLLATLLLAFTLRLYRLDYQELRGDEVFGYFFSLRTLSDIVEATIALQEPHPVASYYLQHLWLNWLGDVGAGHGEFALRFLSLWFGVLAVALLYALGRQLLHLPSAIVAALLLALSPYAVWHSQDARMYSMSLALTTASTWLMVLWLQRQRYGLALGYVVVSWLALHTHYFAVFVLVAQNLFVLGRMVRSRRLSATLSTALSTTFINWLILQATVAFFYGPWVFRVQSILTGYGGNGDSPTLMAMLWRSLSVFTVGESTPQGEQIWWAWLAGLLLITGALLLWQQGERGRRAGLLFGLYLTIPLLATWWSATQRPIFNERYLVAALPGFILLVAATWDHWRSADGSETSLSAPIRLSRPQNGLPQLLILTLLALLASGMLFSLYRHYADPVYSKTRGWWELATTMERWSAGLPVTDVRIAQNFPDPTLWYYYNGPVKHVVLPPGPQDLAGALAMVETLVAEDIQRVILPRQPAVNWDDGEIATTVLADHYAFVLEQAVGVWPVALYHLPADELNSVNVAFANGLQLTGFTAQPQQATAGGVLVVEFGWQGATASLAGSEKVFVQLLNDQGELVAQDDRLLSYPSTATDHRTIYGILLPANVVPGQYELIAGLYDPAQPAAPRVLTTDGADFVRLTTLMVEGN